MFESSSADYVDDINNNKETKRFLSLFSMNESLIWV